MQRALRLMLQGLSPLHIGPMIGVDWSTVYKWRENLFKYQCMIRPPRAALGRPHILTRADKDALLNTLLTEGWMYQDEMCHWLYEERGVIASQSQLLP